MFGGPVVVGPARTVGRSEWCRLRRNELLDEPRGELLRMARIISVANQKGGVGKTTIRDQHRGRAGQVRAASALVVDIDPQCNATSGLGVEPAQRHPSARRQAAGRERGRDGAAAAVRLARLAEPGRRRCALGLEPPARVDLRQQLTGELSHFEYVFLDCPPSLGQLTRAALGASGEIYIPIQCEYFAMEGLSQIIELARQTKARENHRLEIGGIVLTMYDPSLELANEVAERGPTVFR